MPYPCAPGETAKMESCVEKVMAQGHDKSSAVAICCESVGKAITMSQAAEKLTRKQKREEREKLRQVKMLQHKAEMSAMSLADRAAQIEEQMDAVPEFIDPVSALPAGKAVAIEEKCDDMVSAASGTPV